MPREGHAATKLDLPDLKARITDLLAGLTAKIGPTADFEQLFKELLELWPSDCLNYEYYGRVDIIVASKHYSAGLLEETLNGLELALDSLNRLPQSRTEEGLLDELEFEACLTA